MFDGQSRAGVGGPQQLLSHGLYGMFGVGVGSGSAALAAYSPDSIFEGNVVYGFDPETLGWIQSNYPGGNTYVPDAAAVVFGEGTGYQVIAAHNDSRAEMSRLPACSLGGHPRAQPPIRRTGSALTA